MGQVIQTIEIEAPADDVWALVGDPGRIGEWVPALATSVLEEDRRSCTTEDGATIVERILEHSDERRSYVYEITSSPLPLSWYRSQLAVHAHGGHAHIVWEAEFEAVSADDEPELVDTFEQIYRQGLATLRARFRAAA